MLTRKLKLVIKILLLMATFLLMINSFSFADSAEKCPNVKIFLYLVKEIEACRPKGYKKEQIENRVCILLTRKLIEEKWPEPNQKFELKEVNKKKKRIISLKLNSDLYSKLRTYIKSGDAWIIAPYGDLVKKERKLSMITIFKFPRSNEKEIVYILRDKQKGKIGCDLKDMKRNKVITRILNRHKEGNIGKLEAHWIDHQRAAAFWPKCTQMFTIIWKNCECKMNLK